MEISRRTLLNAGLAGAGAMSFASSLGCASPANNPSSEGTLEPFVELETLNFWTGRAQQPLQQLPDGSATIAPSMPIGGQPVGYSGDRATTSAAAAAKSNAVFRDAAGVAPSTVANSSPQAAFVFYDPKLGFLPVTRMGNEGLLEKGDTAVTLDVQRLRPSVADRASFDRLQAGSLRIDFAQTSPLPGLAEKLAWTTLAGMYPDKQGKLPAVQELTFDPTTAWGQSQGIKLPGGGGLWRWNFFLQKKASRWGWLLETARKLSKPVSEVISMSGFAATALRDLDLIFAAVQAQDRTEWLLKSQPTYISTTQDQFQEGHHLPLRSGRYIAVSESHLHLLESATTDGKELELSVEGLIVPKGTSGLSVYLKERETLPDLSYLSINVRVTKA